MSVWLSCLVCRSVSRCLFERRSVPYFVGAGRRFLVLAVLVCVPCCRVRVGLSVGCVSAPTVVVV